MNNNELERRLADWKPELPNRPGFHGEVWRRIEDKKSSNLLSTLDGMINFITRPIIGLPAAAIVTVFAVLLAIHNGIKERDDTWTNHNSTEVRFCCKDCIKDFNSDPEKYLSKIK